MARGNTVCGKPYVCMANAAARDFDHDFVRAGFKGGKLNFPEGDVRCA